MRVTKRNGSYENMKFDKVTTRISNLTYDLSSDVSATKVAQKVLSAMYDGIKTQEIDTLSAETCIGMLTLHPDYEILATRLVASNLQKIAPKSFSSAMKILYDNDVLSRDVWTFVFSEREKLNKSIQNDLDFSLGFFGIKTLEKSYLQKVKGQILETPQYMFMRVACGIHSGDVDRVIETYNYMSRGYFIHATPTLFNAGTKYPQLSSCFLLASKDDSIDGIYDTLKETAQISKWAGGIGLHIHNIRGNKSRINGTNGVSDGIVPMLRVFNSTARYVNQAGRRKGSFALYLEPWHSDVMEFLELRLNQGDEEARTRDLFTALWIPDLFMKRVEEDGQWSLFSPDTAPGLSDCYGDEFEELYKKYEAEGRAVKTLPASKVWMAILKSQVETGTPYMLYKDACNKKSNQKNLGTIKSSNLCVAPETKILTTDGYKTISDLRDVSTEVWNGEEFSEVTVRQTGENQKLLTVKTSSGASLRCTPYHKFYISGQSDPIEAKDLKEGMKLIKSSMPVINTSSETMKYAYTHGLFCADGTTSQRGELKRCSYKAHENGLCKRHQQCVKEHSEDGGCQANSRTQQKFLDLYHGKRDLLKYCDYDYYNDDESVKRYRLRLPKDMDEKYKVPHDYSLQSKLEWIAGLLDGDGCVAGGTNIQMASIHIEFLNEILLLLQTMGVSSKVTSMRKKTTRLIHGVEYETKALSRLLISSKGVRTLMELGTPFRRLVFEGTPNRSAERFNTIVCVEDNGETGDTYCFNEPKRHMGVFNGILTGNCTEIVQHTDKDHTSVCNLGSLALPRYVENGKFNYQKLREVVRVLTRNLNRVIDVNYYPVETAKRSNLKNRPIGLGVQGLADVFNLCGLAFDSKEARDMNLAIFETIYYAALEESIELAKQEGVYETYEDSPASQGTLQFDMWDNPRFSGLWDWPALKKKLAKWGLRNSLLVAPMPTASTAQILGNNECFEPYTTNIYLRRTLAGEFVVVNKHLVCDLQKLGLWSREMKDKLIAHNGSVQNIPEIPDNLKVLYTTVWEMSQKVIIDMARERGFFVDQSQSMNLFLENPNVSKLSSMHMYAWKSGLKTGMYYLRTKAKSKAIQFTLEPCTTCSA